MTIDLVFFIFPSSQNNNQSSTWTFFETWNGNCVVFIRLWFQVPMKHNHKGNFALISPLPVWPRHISVSSRHYLRQKINHCLAESPFSYPPHCRVRKLCHCIYTLRQGQPRLKELVKEVLQYPGRSLYCIPKVRWMTLSVVAVWLTTSDDSSVGGNYFWWDFLKSTNYYLRASSWWLQWRADDVNPKCTFFIS